MKAYYECYSYSYPSKNKKNLHSLSKNREKCKLEEKEKIMSRYKCKSCWNLKCPRIIILTFKWLLYLAFWKLTLLSILTIPIRLNPQSIPLNSRYKKRKGKKGKDKKRREHSNWDLWDKEMRFSVVLTQLHR